MLEPLKSLSTGYFSQALVKCLLRSRTAPKVWRTDRGPEMVNAVHKELAALCNVRQVTGAALTPRHQGLGERGHQTMMVQLTLLLKAVVNAFPQEWAALLPAVEFLLHTAPQGAHGLSAHDLSCAYGIATTAEARLMPFMVPTGLPETHVAANLFNRFRELYGVFKRATQDAAFKQQLKENKLRVDRTFEPGETVFRRLPRPARMPQHLFSHYYSLYFQNNLSITRSGSRRFTSSQTSSLTRSTSRVSTIS